MVVIDENGKKTLSNFDAYIRERMQKMYGDLVLIDDETGQAVAREDTALDEMLLFANYLNSLDVTRWCNKNDVSIVIDGDAIQMTGIINDTTYEFRSRLVVNFYFTQETVGDNAGSPAVASQQN